MNTPCLAYPKLSGDVVESLNALASVSEIPVPTDGERHWAIRPGLPCGVYERCLTLDVRVGGSPLKVHLDRAGVDAALGDLIAWPAFERVDQDLRAAILDTALARPLALLTNLLRAEVLLDDVPAPADRDTPEAGRVRAAPEELLCEVRTDNDIVRCSVLVEVTGPLPRSVIELLATFRRSCDCGGLPCPVTFELGYAGLSEAELRSLEPGDIVLFDRCYLSEDRLRVNVCDRVSCIGTLDGFDLTVVEAEV